MFIELSWGLAKSANASEWAYTTLGVVTSIITIMVLMRDWGDWQYQREAALKYPGSNRGELIVAVTEIVRCLLALLCQFIIVGLGAWAMFTPPANPNATQITPLGWGFAIGLSLLELLLVAKALVMFVADRRLSAVSAQEIAAGTYRGRERRSMTSCPHCGGPLTDTGPLPTLQQHPPAGQEQQEQHPDHPHTTHQQPAGQ